jgi:aspartokinase
LQALGDMHVHMVSLSASGINLTVVVDGAAMHDAMRALHAQFFAPESVS